MKDLDIQVGDRLTYKSIGKIFIELIKSSRDLKEILFEIENKDTEILKIERIGENGWYTVYEKKDLLTDEEREFLKNIIKYYDGISRIETTLSSISFENDNFHIICIIDYPKKLKFENIKKNEYYTLKDLGLEEEVCEK